MPRPKGSKNRPRQAQSAPKTPAVTLVRASDLATPNIMDAVNAFGDKLIGGGEQVTAILSDLIQGFEDLTELVTGVNGTAPKTKKPASSSKPTSTKPSDSEEDEPEDEEGIGEMDANELQDFIDDKDLDVNLGKIKGISKQREAVLTAWQDQEKDADDEDEPEDDEDEDDAEEPEDDEAPDFNAMDGEELAEYVEEHELDVDLSKIKGLSKKRLAVAEAYADAEPSFDDD